MDKIDMGKYQTKDLTIEQQVAADKGCDQDEGEHDGDLRPRHVERATKAAVIQIAPGAARVRVFVSA